MCLKSRQINLPDQIVGLMLIGLIICVGSVFYTLKQIALRIDEGAAVESINRVGERIESLRAQVQMFSQDYNNWSHAYRAAQQDDIAFLSDNYGITAVQGKIFDTAVIYGGLFDTPISWIKDGGRTPGEHQLSEALLVKVEAALSDQAAMRPNIAFVVGDTGMVSFVSAARLLPDPDVELTKNQVASAPIAIISRRLTANDLEDISAAAGVRELHLSREADAAVTSLPLLNVDGEAEWHLTWREPRPSVVMMQRLVPVMAIVGTALLAMAILATWLVRSNARSLVQREVEARQLARTDQLTALPNRLALDEFLRSASGPASQELVFVMLDLDRLKQTNDILGHAVGDAVIQAFSDRIRQCADQNSFVARLGGDEFCAIVCGTAAMDRAHALVTGLDICCATKIKVKGYHLKLSFTAGVAQQGADDHPEEALRKADLAMRRTKSNPIERIGIYDDNMDLADKSALLIEQALRCALSAPDQFSIVYQPVKSVEGDHVVAMEALARWNNPVLGVISPERFIQIAENANLITDLGWIIIDQIFHDLSMNPHVNVLINVSPLQIMDNRFLPEILARLCRSGVETKRIEFELTERVMVGDPEEIAEKISQIRAKGIRVALDDFGTGFSAIRILTATKFDTIKIDGSLVRAAVHNYSSAKLIASVASLCRAVCDSVIVEGIETEEQAHLARSIGATGLQGYFIGKPANMCFGAGSNTNTERSESDDTKPNKISILRRG